VRLPRFLGVGQRKFADVGRMSLQDSAFKDAKFTATERRSRDGDVPGLSDRLGQSIEPWRGRLVFGLGSELSGGSSPA
jgi:hypothetical protein